MKRSALLLLFLFWTCIELCYLLKPLLVFSLLQYSTSSALALSFLTAELINSCICNLSSAFRCLRHWNHFLLLREKVISLFVLLALFPYFKEKCGEVFAISVSPECRGQGQEGQIAWYDI